MAKLIYGMIMSLDGYTEDAHGDFGWGAPDDDDVHTYFNELASSVGTYLYGRRMYQTMVFWETARHVTRPAAAHSRLGAAVGGSRKIVYSRTLAEPRSARTRIERAFDPDAVRRLKAGALQDITVNGPELAAHAIRSGLVDEIQMIICPLVLGGGNGSSRRVCG